MTTPPPLTVRQAMVLAHAELRGSRWHRAGTIRENLGCSEWVYAAELDALLDTQAAEAAEPALVHRLRRLRAQRAAARSGARAACALGTQSAAEQTPTTTR